MVWTGIPLPNTKKGWIFILVGGALGFSFFVWAVQSGEIELFETAYDAVFWIFFAFFWGCILWFILTWIIKKIKNLF